MDAGRRPIVLAMGSPYSIEGIDTERVPTLVGFGASDHVIAAAASALYRSAAVCGKMPVRVSESLDREAGTCLEQLAPRIGIAEEIGMQSEELRKLHRLVSEAIADSAFPGAALAVGRGEVLSVLRGYGAFTYDDAPRVTPRSVFDLASLTKVVATTTAVMKLYDSGALRLDDPVARYIPAFADAGKASVTIRQLLTHTGGLIPFRPFYRQRPTPTQVVREILADSLIYEPGADYRYSDLGPIVLAWVVETISGQSFDDYTRQEIFEPLGMFDTGFRPVSRAAWSDEIVPTEQDNYFRRRLVQGVVHDETAYVLGGAAGNAGLFSTAADLARFAWMMSNEGRVGNTQFLKPETVRLFTTAADPDRHTRALGWDTRSLTGYSSAGRHFGRFAYGHTGFTGTSMWIDPDQRLFVVLLTNRVYPTRDNSGHRPVRPAVADIAFEAILTGPQLVTPGSGDPWSRMRGQCVYAEPEPIRRPRFESRRADSRRNDDVHRRRIPCRHIHTNAKTARYLKSSSA